MSWNLLLQLAFWVLKPVNGLLSFIEFIAFINYTPELVDPLTKHNAWYWVLAVLIGMYASTVMLAACWVTAADNYRDRFFPHAFGYPPLRLVVLIGLYFAAYRTGDLFLFWYDLAAVLVVWALWICAAIRGYTQQEPPSREDDSKILV